MDCRIEWSDQALFARHLPHIRYLHHGIADARQPAPAAWFEAGVAFVREAGPSAVVLTHCHLGMNRGPSLGYAVLLAQGWDAIDAISVLRRSRPIATAFYAEDALRWYHGRAGTDPSRDLQRLAKWRERNPIEVVRGTPP